MKENNNLKNYNKLYQTWKIKKNNQTKFYLKLMQQKKLVFFQDYPVQECGLFLVNIGKYKLIANIGKVLMVGGTIVYGLSEIFKEFYEFNLSDKINVLLLEKDIY